MAILVCWSNEIAAPLAVVSVHSLVRWANGFRNVPLLQQIVFQVPTCHHPWGTVHTPRSSSPS